MTHDNRQFTPNGGLSLDDHLSRSHIVWKKSGDQAWKEIQQQIQKQPVITPLDRRTLYARYSIAAVLILLFGITLFIRFYSKVTTTEYGHPMAITLPDGSEVNLQAGSKLAWNPLWWKISRIATLQGEAFFHALPGGRFTVKSEQGSTTVLGTSFNILARDNRYEITCMTGQVKAEAKTTKQQIIINAGERAILNSSGIFILKKNNNTEHISGWENNMFTFTSAPLQEVWKEVMRQYGIILYYPVTNHLYTGFFSRSMEVETVLNLIGKPFGLTFIKKAENEYEIIPDKIQTGP
ncbi:MAG: DUF4974 domain-containing protein [Bacteroidia bacterium]|nr:DUF4974 domain-containing protein [Bacteroidia bacterium]